MEIEKYKNLALLTSEPLTDNQYLEKYFLYLYRHRLNENWLALNPNLICIASSKKTSVDNGFKKIDEFIGKRLSDVNSKVSESAEVLNDFDYTVLNTLKKFDTVDIHEYVTGTSIMHAVRIPIINPYTKNILGVFAFGNEICFNHGIKTIYNIHAKQLGKHNEMILSDQVPNISLTNREHEVLFIICIGFCSYKSIAAFLSFILKKQINSETTIHAVIKNLYKKFSCNRITALRDFAIANNLYLYLPKSFIQPGAFTILK